MHSAVLVRRSRRRGRPDSEPEAWSDLQRPKLLAAAAGFFVAAVLILMLLAGGAQAGIGNVSASVQRDARGVRVFNTGDRTWRDVSVHGYPLLGTDYALFTSRLEAGSSFSDSSGAALPRTPLPVFVTISAQHDGSRVRGYWLGVAL